MSSRIRRVALAGLGLIGGSLGLSLTAGGGLEEVLGYDPAPEVSPAALAHGAVTRAVGCLADLAEADLIIIATPVRTVVPTIRSLLPHLHPGTIITDTASTKAEIVAALASVLPEGIYFVGGHPFAGSEKAGLAAADAYLFENAVYVLTDEPAAPNWVYDELRSILACTGARFLILNPREHDLIAAGISHLPHLVAAALVNTAAAIETGHPGALTLAGGGFRDTTRIAGSEAGLWAEILGTNRGPLLETLAIFRQELARLEKSLSSASGNELAELLAKAKATRNEIPARSKGLISPVAELVVAIQDRPGAIKQVLDVLAADWINVKDIEILHLREGEGGTLRLGVEDETAVTAAVASLERHGFRAKPR